MKSYVQSLFEQAQIGVQVDLEGAGTPLENPFVYDSAAAELKELAKTGKVTIVEESMSSNASLTGSLVAHISFVRVR